MNFVSKTLTCALAGLVILVAGCEQPAPEGEAQEVARNVRVLDISTASIAEFFEISGPVTPVRGAWLSAQESGPVVAIHLDKGQAVSSGGIIIEQERDILRAERDAMKAALQMQEYNVDKVRQLYDAGKVSRIELLTAESAFAQARSMATVSSERYDRAGIRAPFDGVVTDRFVELGELVNPGQRVARLIDPYTLKLEAQVEIEIPNAELIYNSGVIGRARLGKNEEAGVVVIPRDAVLAGRVGPTAYVVEKDRAVLRQLRLGSDQGLMVIVRDGLQPGDLLVVRGHRDLREGGLVTITERAAEADGSIPSDPGVLTGRESGAGTAEVEAGQ